MTKFMQPKFIVHAGGSKKYRDNYDRIFAKREPHICPRCNIASKEPNSEHCAPCAKEVKEES